MSSAAIVYREELGIPSEVFISHQVAALQRFEAHIVCIRGPGGGFGQAPITRLFGEHPSRLSVAIRRTTKSLPSGVVRLLRRLAPKIVHSHFGIDSILGLELATRLGVPLVATFHGYDVFRSDLCLRRQGYAAASYVRHRSELADRCTRFIAVSRHVATALSRSGFPESRIIQHYIGVDTQFFRPPAQPTRSPIVLFIGRLVRSKGADHLIAAMSAVQSHLPNARLVVIGAGPEESRLRRLAAGSLQSAKFLGVCTPDEVRSWLHRSMVVALPSVPTQDGYVEAFGLVLVEAQATGVPVVAFRTGGISEAVEHGETGLLSEPGDCKDLARNIEGLLCSPELWRRYSDAGRRRAVCLFDLNRQTAILEEIYDEAILAASLGEA